MSAKIGSEYIVGAIGEEFRNKKLYFVCLLCDITKKYSALGEHLSSYDHQYKFLVSFKLKLKSFEVNLNNLDSFFF